MKQILVTGAAGFLGSHLVEKHLEAGDLVQGVDNFCSSHSKSRHHTALLQRPHYNFLCADIGDKFFYNMLCEKKFDVIYNFACPASPPIYQSIPIQTTMTCVAGTKNVLDLSGQGTVVVHASTSEVYGDPNVSPQPESYFGNVNPYGPRSCYDEGKRAAEALCFDYLNKLNTDVRVVRIFNTYGPRMDPNDGRVMTNFICQSLRSQPITIYGDGTQTRSFCYVDDLIRGIICMSQLKDNPRTPINLGNPSEFTMNQLAQKLVQRFGGEIKYCELPPNDPRQRKPDISLAKTILNWRPEIDLDQGLDRMIEYMKSLNV